MWENRNKLFAFLLWIMAIRLASCMTPSLLCSHIPGLTAQQKHLCAESPDALIALAEGQQLAAQECQYQFRGHRWNCSQVWYEHVFSHVMFVGSREAAYVYAMASAAAAHAVTAACARGNISLCGCDVRHRASGKRQQAAGFGVDVTNSSSEEVQAWKWGGCSPDIDFGMRFARRFWEARELEGDARTLMNLHNNRAGRRIVKNLLKVDCKCHGVSGSCVMKTCWKTLPPLRLVGDVLMKKYNKAKFVQAARSKRRLTLVLSKKARLGKNVFIPKRMELVYLQTSPNYCERNIRAGTPGTQGRSCLRTQRGPLSCDLLCCGRGYNVQQIRRVTQCRCQFRWCCDVQCDICEENFEEFTCK